MKVLKGYIKINIDQKQTLVKYRLLNKLLSFVQSIQITLHQSGFLKVVMTPRFKVGVHEDSML